MRQKKTKKMKSMILAAALAVTVIPMLPGPEKTAKAAPPPDVSQFATKEELLNFNTSGASRSHKVYFGQKENSSDHQAWWIAGKASAGGGPGVGKRL